MGVSRSLVVASVVLSCSPAIAQQPPPLPPPGVAPAAPVAPPPAYPPPQGAYFPGYPVPPGYAPYPYPPPGYAYPPPGWSPPPEEIDDDGQPVPPGYRRVTRVRKGLVISGALVLGIPYTFSISAAAASKNANDRLLFLPGVGPLLDLVARGSCNERDLDCSLAKTFLTLDAVMQVTGSALLLVGLVAPRNVFVRDGYGKAPSATWTIAPHAIAHGGYGLGLVGTL